MLPSIRDLYTYLPLQILGHKVPQIFALLHPREELLFGLLANFSVALLQSRDEG
jgi:hypothetical protein